MLLYLEKNGIIAEFPDAITSRGSNILMNY